MDGKDEDSAAPNSVVLCNLWIVPRDFRPFRDARPNRTEMGNLMIARPNLRNGTVAAYIIYRFKLCRTKLQPRGFTATVTVPRPGVSTVAVPFATSPGV